jgi:hypothetical protein
MNTQVLAGFFNLTAQPVNQGGTNYAISGAMDAATPANASTVGNGNIGNLNPIAGHTLALKGFWR